MARTRKSIQAQNLLSYDVLIEDTGYRSDFFRTTQFDGYLYGGRNAILIAGSSLLKPNTNILIEVINSVGTTIYSAPIAEYVEGSSRLIQIEVYNNTPIGPGKLVIVGCADINVDGSDIPEEWRDAYNVRWTSDVIVSPLVENRTPIRFASQPSMVVEEKFYSVPSSSVFSQKIVVPVDVELRPKILNAYVNGYTAKLKGPVSTGYLTKYLNGVLTGSLSFENETANIQLPITKIYNTFLAESNGALIYTAKDALITDAIISSSGEYTSSILPFGQVIVSSSLQIEYNELGTQSTGSAISFAKIRLVNLETISGEIHKVRISYKNSTDPSEYKLLGDVKTAVNELLTTDTGSTTIQTGFFSTINPNQFWYAATMSAAFNRNSIAVTGPDYYFSSSLLSSNNVQLLSTYLLDAINGTPQIVDNEFIDSKPYFIGNKVSNAFTLFPTTEYTLQFNALVTRQSGSQQVNNEDCTMEVYLVEQSNSTTRLLQKSPLGQLIGTLTPQSTFLTQNFNRVALNFDPVINQQGTFGLRFVIYGGFWNIADISLKAAEEQLFSSDEADILLPNLDFRNSLLSFKAEYLDINNNSVNMVTISTPTYFTGSDLPVENLYFDNN